MQAKFIGGPFDRDQQVIHQPNAVVDMRVDGPPVQFARYDRMYCIQNSVWVYKYHPEEA